MKSIDLKSLIIGILGTGLVFLLMGQGRSPEDEYGPFQVACSGVASNSLCIVIETTTGAWLRTYDLGETRTW